MIDFDKSFAAYLKKWYAENADKLTPDEMEERINSVYEAWADTRDAKLGVVPREYFAAIKDGARLVALLFEYTAGKLPPPNILLDRIAEAPGAENALHNALLDPKLETSDKMLAVNLLGERGSEAEYRLYADWIFDPKIDTELRELAAEILAEHADAVAEYMIARLGGADYEAKDWASCVLVNYPSDNRVYALLMEMFLTGENRQLYAVYLGRYGDERAVPQLCEAAKTCDYVTYSEIMNALERLGSDAEIKRDFSRDVNYRKLKGRGQEG
ncbi:MAG: hypothetical protein LBS99_06165 [Clostridiales bacterium]|nr:hypothetical protein [Clostridiales bacterium]